MELFQNTVRMWTLVIVSGKLQSVLFTSYGLSKVWDINLPLSYFLMLIIFLLSVCKGIKEAVRSTVVLYIVIAPHVKLVCNFSFSLYCWGFKKMISCVRNAIRLLCLFNFDSNLGQRQFLVHYAPTFYFCCTRMFFRDGEHFALSL